MNVFWRVLAVVASLLLAAHFLRQAMILRAIGSSWDAAAFALVAAALALPFLLFVERPWGTALLRGALALAALEWVRYLVELALRRRAEGAPWVRAVAILSSVAVITAAAAVFLRAPTDTRSERS